jgi:hypothetical protein
MHSDRHNPNATDLADSIGRPIDRRDERGRDQPDRHHLQGSPQTENARPAGGMVDPAAYHNKGHFFEQTPQTQPLPLKGK